MPRTYTYVPPAPTATPRPSASEAYIDSYRIDRVIGDRLSSTIYAYTDNGWLYRSDDDGRAWYLITTRPPVDDFLMNAYDPNTLYSGEGIDCSSDEVENVPMYRSFDGGYTWEELPTGVNLRPLITDQGDPDAVFATDCTMLYLSPDAGDSWTAVPDNSELALWDNYEVVSMASASLVDDGITPNWSQLYATGNNLEDRAVVAFTGDLGETWADISPITEGPRAPVPTNAVVVVADLMTAGRLWVVDQKGVWETEDFGVNWTFSSAGLPRGVYGNLHDLTYAYNNMVYVGTVRGMYEKDLVGGEWDRVTDTGFDGENISNFLLTETNPLKLWVNTDDGVFTFGIEED